MIFGSLQAEFMETKHNGHIHRYGAPISGNIVMYVCKPIKIIIEYFGGCKIYLD